MGVPVVIASGGGASWCWPPRPRARTRVAALRALGPPPVVAITAWRAGTLKARAYDGDLARIVMPPDADATWLADLADPARDLMAPMKGPLQTVRDGDATLHRLAILLAKSAQLLPCVLAVEIGDACHPSPMPTG
jgi:GTP cyclohydrolase II